MLIHVIPNPSPFTSTETFSVNLYTAVQQAWTLNCVHVQPLLRKVWKQGEGKACFIPSAGRGAPSRVSHLLLQDPICFSLTVLFTPCLPLSLCHARIPLSAFTIQSRINPSRPFYVGLYVRVAPPLGSIEAVILPFPRVPTRGSSRVL